MVALAIAACFDAGPLIGPGRLSVTIDSPHGEEGAAVLLLAGEAVLAVGSAGETEVHAEHVGDETRVVLIHPTGGTLAFELVMAELSRPLVPVILEVAGPDDELRDDLAGYRVELSR